MIKQKTLNLDITKHEHFKLYVLLEDRFTFENELLKKGIEFYSNSNEQVYASHSIRYYLKDIDRSEIDKIIRKNKINSGIESNGLNRFNFNRKPIIKLVLIIIGIITLLLIGSYLF